VSRLGKAVVIVWLFAFIALLVWGVYPLIAACHQGYCDQLPFGGGIRDEEPDVPLPQDLLLLGVMAIGLPTFILAMVLGTYFSAKPLLRRLNLI
jgi:hypothetical protein